MTTGNPRTADLYQEVIQALEARGQRRQIHPDGAEIVHQGVAGFLQPETEQILVLTDSAPANEDDDKTLQALRQLTALDLPPPDTVEYDEEEKQIHLILQRQVELQPGLNRQARENLARAAQLVQAVRRREEIPDTARAILEGAVGLLNFVQKDENHKPGAKEQ